MPAHAFLSPWTLKALRDIPLQALPDFAQTCTQRLAAGERLVTLFGRPACAGEPEDCVLTAVFQPAQGPLEVLRGTARGGARYPSLTCAHPAAQIYERELWEQTGLLPEGHPWLKPVRFEGARQQRMADYPFFQVRGHSVHEVGVGPIHAGVIEPGHFRFMCLGETVYHLEIQLGYQHRGVEAILLHRPAWTLAPLLESVCGDSVVAYAWGHCAAIEALSGRSVGWGTALSRAVALELERVAMHVATLGGLATDIAFLQGGSTYGRLRTAIINATQRVCGNRFGRGWIRPGRSSVLSDALREDLVQTLRAFAVDFAQVNERMRTARSVTARCLGVGTVSTQAARDLGLLGVVARASGVAQDVRTELPGPVYGAAPLSLVTEPQGDCWARVLLRMREAEQSVAWLLRVLEEGMPEGAEDDQGITDASSFAAAPPALQPEALCVSLTEGARGPVVQVLETGAGGELRHYKVQDPSLANWYGLALAVRDNAISDFPLCNKSFDLSYCGNDL